MQDANSQVAVARAISHLNAPQDQELKKNPRPYGTQRHKPALKRTSLHEDSTSTEAGILPGISRECNARSSIHWFTEFCNSQCSSHFAAPFIVVRAETSVAESCTKPLYPWTTTHDFMRLEVQKFNGIRQQGTRTEDGPFSACRPRVSARGHRCDLHPPPDPHRRLCTMNRVDACE